MFKTAVTEELASSSEFEELFNEASPINWLLILLVLALVSLIVALVQSRRLLHKEQLEKEALAAHLNDLNPDLENYRIFRHDYRNVIASLAMSLEEGNIAESRRIYESVLDESLFLLNTPRLNLSKIEVPAIRSLILVKALEAEKVGVSFKLETIGCFEDTAINRSLTLYRVFALLLDEAILVLKDFPDSKVNLGFITSNQIQKIIVSYPMVPGLAAIERKTINRITRIMERDQRLALIREERGGNFYQTLTIEE
ncbi:hypothetical protein [Eupransor demetentiae]|uniref:Sensor histidine kinase DipB regulating citrate/malate metabolism (CitA) n=1 Tax=Eupransor demetentiae TaxID=3109584 RepID=A0ABM9N544_9LACO|nr:Sensor histidine kinase DipB regulating citrate/malate metabolism (CitA) [Lactobacillaceae bacterium LMG 33000]